ncbi:DUF2336 domain-containing protein [Nitratireductor basaltis]|uniref:DUF2336 domain-containing protein n=1 Tax=Nitratireductor basaltis TaxID=472175 RepID=A0A084UBA4_9HYPH|nr:DUF2336 domain-containing protein [Nitratireductor basaltis]KFB10240.1 hypothetical protein EL18_01270 [Nitratireductor basaltis]
MVVIQHFLKWLDTAKMQERADAAAALARAFVQRELSFDDRLAAEAALTLLLDDRSAKVRLALSETLSLSARAPAHIIAALAADQAEVAAPVLARSPLLSDAELIDRVALGCIKVQMLIASRPRVSRSLSASIAEVGSVEACTVLARNEGAEIAPFSFRRMIERFGANGPLREALTHNAHLPADCRHLLVQATGTALSALPLVKALMGEERAGLIAKDACARASVTLIESVADEEHEALVEHLRLRGEVTSGFLVRIVAHGKIDFFRVALAAITGQDIERVTALLARGRHSALAALFKRAGLSTITHAPILTALDIWREVARGNRMSGPQEVSWSMLQAVDAAHGADEAEQLTRLLRQIHLEQLRRNARQQALELAAA